jgi:hypothetical protein
LVGIQEPHDMLDRHRLPRAGEPDDDHRLSLLDLEGEAAEDLVVAEGFVDVFEDDHLTAAVSYEL